MNKKNILITGSNGQLGSEIRAIIRKDNYFFTDISDLDITDKERIADFVKQNNIQIIVNCAAYTNVDKAEEDKETVDLVNRRAVKNLAEICSENKIFLIHISTDYVFDGQKNTPYKETDTTNPLGVYGNTKLEGEKAVQNICNEYLIFRTSWLYSSYGNNFVKTIRRLGKEKEKLRVVFDQVGTPTYAENLAECIIYIIENNLYKNKKEIYHFSNEGVCSWYDFACEIIRFSGINCEIEPCHSDEYPTKVTRPNYSVLDKTKLKADFNYTIPHWRNALEKCIVELKKTEK